MPTSEKEKVSLSIALKKGVAANNRIPLDHMITTLRAIQAMIRDVGRKIQRDAGEEPTGDFGIDLVAGKAGIAFRKGSIYAAAEATRNTELAIQTFQIIVKTTDVLQKKTATKPLTVSDYGEEVLKRLPSIAEIQEADNTELHLSIKEGRQTIGQSTFGARGLETLRSLESAEFKVEAVTLYGKLRELRDMSPSEKESSHFWGELLEDNGHYWRVRFDNSDQAKVISLFRKQVWIVGEATYFKTKVPRLEVKEIHGEPLPDYVTAFDQFSAAYADIFADADADHIIADIKD